MSSTFAEIDCADMPCELTWIDECRNDAGEGSIRCGNAPAENDRPLAAGFQNYGFADEKIIFCGISMNANGIFITAVGTNSSARKACTCDAALRVDKRKIKCELVPD